MDTQGFDSIAFIALMGDLTAASALEWAIVQGEDSGLSDGADTAAVVTLTADGTTDDNGVAIIEAARLTDRYCRLDIKRATQNAEIDGVIAVLFNAGEVPVTQPSDVIASVFKVSPAES
ncbi:MAG: hypothetical protein ACF8R7_07265 [Phycisphaerales bacterium JB039]